MLLICILTHKGAELAFPECIVIAYSCESTLFCERSYIILWHVYQVLSGPVSIQMQKIFKFHYFSRTELHFLKVPNFTDEHTHAKVYIYSFRKRSFLGAPGRLSLCRLRTASLVLPCRTTHRCWRKVTPIVGAVCMGSVRHSCERNGFGVAKNTSSFLSCVACLFGLYRYDSVTVPHNPCIVIITPPALKKVRAMWVVLVHRNTHFVQSTEIVFFVW